LRFILSLLTLPRPPRSTPFPYTTLFRSGGLLGAFAAAPLAKRLGRRPMFIAYFLFSALALFATFGLVLAPQTRLSMLFFVGAGVDRKSTRLNSSHLGISYAVFCLKKKNT